TAKPAARGNPRMRAAVIAFLLPLAAIGRSPIHARGAALPAPFAGAICAHPFCTAAQPRQAGLGRDICYSFSRTPMWYIRPTTSYRAGLTAFALLGALE